MNLNIARNLRDRRFRAIGRSLGLDPYTVDRLIELGMVSRLSYLGDPSGGGADQANVRVIDCGLIGPPREYAAANVSDAEFFVKEFNRRSQSVHTEGGIDL
jgi:hypothetical protein